MHGCKHLGLDSEQLDAACAQAKKGKKLAKFGGVFYCGLVEVAGKEPVYISNVFFTSMRSKFTQPDTQIYYYSPEWDLRALSWADFRGKVLGPTTPAEVPEGHEIAKVAVAAAAAAAAATTFVDLESPLPPFSKNRKN